MNGNMTRREFLKTAGAVSAAVAAAGLLGGCSNNDDTTPSTEIVLGDYKVDVDMSASVLGKNGDGTGTVTPKVRITNATGGAVTMPFVRDVFPQMTAGETDLKPKNSKTETVTLPMKVPQTCSPVFLIEDSELYRQINRGDVDVKLTVKLSGQKAVYTLNFDRGTKSVQKVND